MPYLALLRGLLWLSHRLVVALFTECHALRHSRSRTLNTIERLRQDPAEHVKPHVETVVGRMLFDERSYLKVMEALRLVRSFRTPAILRGLLAASVLVLPVLRRLRPARRQPLCRNQPVRRVQPIILH